MNNTENQRISKNIYLFSNNKDHNHYSFLTTASNNINKIISQKRYSIKKTILQDIILTNDFSYQLIKENVNEKELTNELNFLNRNIKLILHQQDNKKMLEYTKTTHKITQEINLNYGLQRENELMDLLGLFFGLTLTHSKYEYSLFDFYSNNGLLFELKSYTYSYNKYNTEIISTRKALSLNSIFIFSHQEEEDFSYYYIQYDPVIFNNFEIVFIKSPNRNGQEECYKIEKQYLTKFNFNEKITTPLIPVETEAELVLNIITTDQRRSKGLFSNHTINNVIEHFNSLN